MNKGQVEFADVNEALAELNAVDRGRYFLCTCPECEKNEAFMYKNNVNFIQCNRENECGESTFIRYREKVDEISPKYKELMNSYPELNEQQVEAIDWYDRALNHMSDSASPTLEGGYRGLSEDVTKEFVADFQSEGLVGFMFDKIKPLLQKDYSNNDWMKKRNLVLPIRGDDGNVERVLLRSSIKPDIEPKEIQLVVNPSKETRDFFIDVSNEAETVVIAEALFDGLSFKEIDPAIGVVALTGSSKTRGLKEYINQNRGLFQNKNIILAMDNDKAGWKANQDLMTTLNDCRINYEFFQYPEHVNDPNEFLQHDRNGFARSLELTKKRLLSNERDMVEIKEGSKVVICTSKLDAVSFRAVDENIGVIALEEGEKDKVGSLEGYVLRNEYELQSKEVVLALRDNDEGKQVADRLKLLLDAFEIETEAFDYPTESYLNVTSPYQYSKVDRKGFERNVEGLLKKEKMENRMMVHEVGVER